MREELRGCGCLGEMLKGHAEGQEPEPPGAERVPRGKSLECSTGGFPGVSTGGPAFVDFAVDVFPFIPDHEHDQNQDSDQQESYAGKSPSPSRKGDNGRE